MPLSAPSREAFAADVRDGLTRQPKQLHPKYFYDALGSSLFEAICRLPWYRITRAECQLLATVADDLAQRVWATGVRPEIVELGCGNGEKLEVLARALAEYGGARVHLVDVSAQALAQSSRRLRQVGAFEVIEHETDYESGLRAAARACDPDAAMLVLFLGSNIGNFNPADARRFLRELRGVMPDGAWLLLGVDLVKPERDLQLAYDDPLGVTAAFNRNLLVRMNAELGADFDLPRFDHLAVWNAGESRVEMHLVSREAQTVRIPAAGIVVHLDAGERLWTESSYKYTPEGIERMADEQAFRMRERWIDEEARFALTLFDRPARPSAARAPIRFPAVR
jgi:dimethylhistidine N-methyltransferase